VRVPNMTRPYSSVGGVRLSFRPVFQHFSQVLDRLCQVHDSVSGKEFSFECTSSISSSALRFT
jgi:hypothetical protein